MKIIMLSCLILLALNSFSQESTAGLRSEFSQISKYTYGRQSGFEALQSFSSKDVKGSQFYFPAWSAGALITAANETMAGDYLFLFDKVRQVLFMKPKDSAVVLEADKDKIKGFRLNQNGTHMFEKASDYTPDDHTDFYEVLVKNDSGYTLLKQVKTKFVKFDAGNMANMAKIRDGETADEFQDEVSYYVSYKHGVPQAIKPKDNSIKKVLANEKGKVTTYLDSNADAERNESFLNGLIDSLNQ